MEAMEAMTTIILTVLCFYGLYALAKAVEREQAKRKAPASRNRQNGSYQK